MKSLHEVLCPGVSLHTGCSLPKAAGDLVMIGDNHGPVYQIVHIAEALAWVRPLTNGEEGLVLLERLRLVDDASRI